MVSFLDHLTVHLGLPISLSMSCRLQPLPSPLFSIVSFLVSGLGEEPGNWNRTMASTFSPYIDQKSASSSSIRSQGASFPPITSWRHQAISNSAPKKGLASSLHLLRPSRVPPLLVFKRRSHSTHWRHPVSERVERQRRERIRTRPSQSVRQHPLMAGQGIELSSSDLHRRIARLLLLTGYSKEVDTNAKKNIARRRKKKKKSKNVALRKISNATLNKINSTAQFTQGYCRHFAKLPSKHQTANPRGPPHGIKRHALFRVRSYRRTDLSPRLTMKRR